MGDASNVELAEQHLLVVDEPKKVSEYIAEVQPGSAAAQALKLNDPYLHVRFFERDIRDTCRIMSTSEITGLSPAEVVQRRAIFGSNELPERKGKSILAIVFGQLINSVTAILTGVFIIAIVGSDWIEAAVVLAVICLNSGLGIAQEVKSEHALAAIREMVSAGQTTVIRNEREIDVNINDLVVGDLVELRHGQRVPADIRLVSCTNMEIDESILTGESVPVLKTYESMPPPKNPDDASTIAAINMAFRQTNISQGFGRGIVIATGLHTQIGKIQKRLNAATSNKTPLTRSLDNLMFILLIIGIIFSVLIFWAFQWEVDNVALLYASATLVAILPEAAIVLVTMTMALGVRKMARQNAIVRKMIALEQIGRVTDICSDKTGTLTRGRMSPAAVMFWHYPKQTLSVLPSIDEKVVPRHGGRPAVFHVRESDAGVPRDDEEEEELPEAYTGGGRVEHLTLVGPALSSESKWYEGLTEDPVREIKSLQRWIHAPAAEEHLDEEKGENERLEGWKDLLLVSTLCSISRLHANQDGTLVGSGNPTELALQELIHKAAKATPEIVLEEAQSAEKYAHTHMAGRLSRQDSRSLLRKPELSVSRQHSNPEDPDESTHLDSVLVGVSPEATQELIATVERRGRTLEFDAYDELLRRNWELRGEWSFDSTSKRMSNGWRHRDTGDCVVLTKGGPEIILPLCAGLSQADREMLEQQVVLMASRALRVIALALRSDVDLRAFTLTDLVRTEVECDLRFVGFVGIRDPPKPESLVATRECVSAGVRVRMLTGDHKETAVAIAREIGILSPDDNDEQVMTGPALDRMTDEELDKMPDLPFVVARCSPQSKVKITEGLQRRGKVVAMTGDGVNDAMAIKEADVGIAMGLTGSDVTKSVSDIVLADDNFATIVMAVSEGRQIFDSIYKFVMHLLSGNVGEAVALMLSLAFIQDANGKPVFVLSPIAVLWINTATGWPALCLVLDPAAPDLMTRPPLAHGLFTWELMIDSLVYGAIMGLLTLGAYLFDFNIVENRGSVGISCNKGEAIGCADVEYARASAFLSLCCMLSLQAYNCRHTRLSFFQLSILSNKHLLVAFIASLLFCVPILYAPVLNTQVFRHEGRGYEWALAAVAMVIFFILSELYKAIKRTLFPAPLGKLPPTKHKAKA